MQANFDRIITLLRDELERREKRHQEQLREATHAPARILPSQNTISKRIWSEPPRVVSWIHDLPTTTHSVPSYNSAPANTTPLSTLPGYFIPRQQSTHSVTQDNTAALLSIQTQAHAYQMLMQCRPKFKFTGNQNKINFEAFVL